MARKKKLSLKNLTNPDYADIVEEARDLFEACQEAYADQFQASLDDINFCRPGGQWPEDIRAERQADNRPCLEVDRLTPFIHQIVNDFRQSRPQAQVNPIGDGADKATAEYEQGMIRHIMYNGNGEVAIDTAFESMVRCGMGYFRILTEYIDDKSFDQEVVLKRIPNTFSVHLDPSFIEPDGSDACYAFVDTWVPADEYRVMYPDSTMASFDTATWDAIGTEAPEWAERDGAAVRVMEYFKKVRTPVKLYRLQDGRVVDTVPPGETPVSDRISIQEKVVWFKLNAVEVLDTTEWPGKYIPIFPMFGTEINADGRREWFGLVRTAKDPLRAFNYWKTNQAETIALAPKAPWVGPEGFMGASSALWRDSNRKNIPVLQYKHQTSQGQPLPPPSRQAIEPPIMAITQAMTGAVDDLKAVTGMYDASLGNREADQSGVAIKQLQRQGQSSNFHYQDNAARTIRHLGRALVDLIPKVYDTQRVVKIVKPDDTADMVVINGTNKDKDGLQKMFDPNVGRYDVSISVGPSFQTRRQENLALMESMLNSPLGKMMATVAPDLLVSMMDFQIAPELQDRLKKTLPPQFQDNQDGQPQVPPQVQAQMQHMGQMVEALTQVVNEYKSKLVEKEAELNAKKEIAVIQARAGILEALVKTGSAEAITAFQAQNDFLNNYFSQLQAQDSEPEGDESSTSGQSTPQQPSQPAPMAPAGPVGGGNGAPVPAGLPGQPGGQPILSGP